MTGRRPRIASARGQALLETMLLTWILLVFVAAAYQLFIVNRQIGESLAHVHAKMMAGAFYHNCADDSERCTNDDGRLKSRAIWTRTEIPDINIARVNMFRDRLASDMRIYSNSPRNLTPDPYCDEPDPACKRTRAAAGTYQPVWDLFPDIADTLADAGTYRYLLESIDDYLLYELRGFIEEFADAIDQALFFIPDEWKGWITDALEDLLADMF